MMNNGKTRHTLLYHCLIMGYLEKMNGGKTRQTDIIVSLLNYGLLAKDGWWENQTDRQTLLYHCLIVVYLGKMDGGKTR